MIMATLILYTNVICMLAVNSICFNFKIKCFCVLRSLFIQPLSSHIKSNFTQLWSYTFYFILYFESPHKTERGIYMQMFLVIQKSKGALQALLLIAYTYFFEYIYYFQTRWQEGPWL